MQKDKYEQDNCLSCKKKCKPAKQLIKRLNIEPWIAAKALDFLYQICEGESNEQR